MPLQFLASLVVIVVTITLLQQTRTEGTESQPLEPSLIQDLSRTYGYYKGQNLSIQSIQKRFPDLQAHSKKAQMGFDIIFRSSFENIEKSLRSAFASQWPEYSAKLQKQLNENLGLTRITREQAALFIEQVLLRAKGQIESPILETLLMYTPSFQTNPVEEVKQGFKRTYRTKDHPKAKGLDFQVEYPASWSKREGQRPNIIQLFSSSNGRGPVSALVITKDIVQEARDEISTKEIAMLKTPQGAKEFASELFSDVNLRVMVQDTGMGNIRDFVTKRITIDRWPGAMFEFVGDQQRVDTTVTMYTRMYIALYKHYVLFLQCYISRWPADSVEDFKSRISRYIPLFQYMANSLVIQSQY